MNWLIICRAVQGIGGGGILQLVQITISDIVSLEEYVESNYLVILPYNTFRGYSGVNSFIIFINQ